MVLVVECRSMVLVVECRSMALVEECRTMVLQDVKGDSEDDSWEAGALSSAVAIGKTTALAAVLRWVPACNLAAADDFHRASGSSPIPVACLILVEEGALARVRSGRQTWLVDISPRSVLLPVDEHLLRVLWSHYEAILCTARWAHHNAFLCRARWVHNAILYTARWVHTILCRARWVQAVLTMDTKR
jgi:hypothetical protein